MKIFDSFKQDVTEYLSKPLPERVGWPHIFGSMLLALFALQFLTGILMSFIYSGSPLSAYRSVDYMMNEMEGGAWLRGIHFWGASTMVIVLGLHLIRTFLYAAYKKPRRLTWVAGVLLLLCVLTFAQTGYLLPWDQKAYWGTKVTMEIVASVPVAGPLAAYVMRGGAAVGALTLSRFFTIHAVILPLVTVFLILFHLWLVRKHGITAPWSDVGTDPPRPIPFHPYQTAKDSAGMLLITGFVLLLAWLVPAPLGQPADPNDTTFVPRPDWYFLFLFESLKFFRGAWEVVGTFVLPQVAVLLAFALPWIDRNPSRKPLRRPVALICLIAALGTWSWLTYSATRSRPHIQTWAPLQVTPRPERIKRPSVVGGMYVLKQRCLECHSMTVFGGRQPLQTMLRETFPAGESWFVDHLSTHGRNAKLSGKEIQELMSVLAVVEHGDPKLLYTIPSNVRFGAHKFYNSACSLCHTIDGQGGKHSEVKAPDLTLRLVRAREWHIKHIRDSRSVVPNSKMPPFWHYEEYEFEALADYILYLHTP